MTGSRAAQVHHLTRHNARTRNNTEQDTPTFTSPHALHHPPALLVLLLDPDKAAQAALAQPEVLDRALVLRRDGRLGRLRVALREWVCERRLLLARKARPEHVRVVRARSGGHTGGRGQRTGRSRGGGASGGRGGGERTGAEAGLVGEHDLGETILERQERVDDRVRQERQKPVRECCTNSSNTGSANPSPDRPPLTQPERCSPPAPTLPCPLPRPRTRIENTFLPSLTGLVPCPRAPALGDSHARRSNAGAYTLASRVGSAPGAAVSAETATGRSKCPTLIVLRVKLASRVAPSSRLRAERTDWHAAALAEASDRNGTSSAED